VELSPVVWIKKTVGEGCLAQSVKHPTLDLGSGLDLRVVSLSPTLGSTLAWSLLSLKKKVGDSRDLWESESAEQILWRKNNIFLACK